jgi:metal-responsive CopG/Arc/MetJ family transcriptional regulator
MPYFYDAENARPVLAVRLAAHQMARIDEARHRLKISRSDLARRALNDLLDRMQVDDTPK